MIIAHYLICSPSLATIVVLTLTFTGRGRVLFFLSQVGFWQNKS